MKTFFAVLLSPKENMIRRFALYYNRPQPADRGMTLLTTLWPKDSHDADRRRISLLPYQVDSKNRNYPRFHFAIQRGTGLDRLAEELGNHFKEKVVIELLEGSEPSTFTSQTY